MIGTKLKVIRCLLLLSCLCGPAVAQDEPTTRNEIWPEVDLYITLNPKWRLFFLANSTVERETNIAREGQVGAHVDYFFNKYLVFRAGYRYGFSLHEDEPFQEQRILFEQTFRVRIPWRILLSDRNRQDLRWVDGEFSVRYRNRLMLERDFSVNSFRFTGYGSAEVYYDTRFDTFNRTRFVIGVAFPVCRVFGLDFSYNRQNDTKSTPNHVNALGINFVFTMSK
ncbi:MAG: DUF2490 domain-containing protein [Acidobacteria bacterium]|nr:DUF2490 domain-containing protein [Acidobacteriota bacterium]